MSSLRRTLVTLTATAAALVPSAAFAQTYTHVDGKGDVVSADDSSNATTPEPTRAEGDVLSSTVAYQAHRVLVTVHYAQLSRTTEFTEQLVAIRTNTGAVRHVVVVAVPNHWRGKVIQETGQGRRWRCTTGHLIDYDHDVVRVSVPRRCLDNPRSVQVGVAAVTGQSQKLYADDAQSATIGNNLVFGPRVFRG